jgi:hypothetical protein
MAALRPERVSYGRYERPKARKGTAGILLYSEEPHVTISGAQ